jgi:hypothetical protein
LYQDGDFLPGARLKIFIQHYLHDQCDAFTKVYDKEKIDPFVQQYFENKKKEAGWNSTD